MENKKQEELQSRREFFKSAAKAALPIVGAIVLSQLPIKAQATEMGCSKYGCGTCTGCGGSCNRSCSGCSGGCQTTCTGGCAHYGCKGYNRA